MSLKSTALKALALFTLGVGGLTSCDNKTTPAEIKAAKNTSIQDVNAKRLASETSLKLKAAKNPEEKRDILLSTMEKCKCAITEEKGSYSDHMYINVQIPATDSTTRGSHGQVLSY